MGETTIPTFFPLLERTLVFVARVGIASPQPILTR